MTTKDPYLSELDELDGLSQDEPTEAHLESPPAPVAEEPAPELSQDAVQISSDVPVQLVVVIGRKPISMKDLIELRPGQVVELDRVPNEAVDIVASGRIVAKGELVEIEGKLGVRVLKLLK